MATRKNLRRRLNSAMRDRVAANTIMDILEEVHDVALTEAELGFLNGATAGTGLASKAVVLDSDGKGTIPDGGSVFIGPAAVPGTTVGGNWIGIEDFGTAPAGTLTNSVAIYADSSGDDLDVLHADGTTDALLT